MKLATIALLAATQANASTLPGVDDLTWSGATSRACDGRCDQSWAETHLTPAELEQLREAQKQPAQRITINDGDYFTLMTFYNERPVAHRQKTHATLDTPEGAVGWQMDGWAFVKIDACQNWAVLRRNGGGAYVAGDQRGSGISLDGGGLVSGVSLGGGSAASLAGSIIGGAALGALSVGSGGQSVNEKMTGSTFTEDMTVTPETEPTPQPAPVPLPASMWLLLAGLAWLGILKRPVRADEYIIEGEA